MCSVWLNTSPLSGSGLEKYINLSFYPDLNSVVHEHHFFYFIKCVLLFLKLSKKTKKQKKITRIISNIASVLTKLLSYLPLHCLFISL